jgi:uncharacterized protein YbjQ (UPF0145 family)
VPKGLQRAFAGLSATVLVAAGCGGAGTYVRGLSPQQKVQARALPVYRETLTEGTYRFVQRVEGISCRVNVIDDYRVSEDEAVEELQYASLKAGGTAVMEVRCEHQDFRRSEYACAESVVCSGVAVVPARKL